MYFFYAKAIFQLLFTPFKLNSLFCDFKIYMQMSSVGIGYPESCLIQRAVPAETLYKFGMNGQSQTAVG